jgi:hypothetical protein
MAKTFNSKIGFNSGRYAVLTEGSSADTYGDVVNMAAVQSGDASITLANASLYGDDALLDEVNEFQSGTLNLKSSGESHLTVAALLGHANASGEITFSTGDEPALVGYGAFEVIRTNEDGTPVNGIRAWFYPKIKFQEPNESYAGKGDSLTYTGTDLTATIFANKAGVWKVQKEFTGETAIDSANTWLDGKFGVTNE